MYTEQQVLDVCNKVREAGGANPLQALLPAIPQHSKECVIAKALNFSCEVGPSYGADAESAKNWVMYVEDDATRDKIEAIFGLGFADYSIPVRHPVSGVLLTTVHRQAVRIPDELAEVAVQFDRTTEDDCEYDWLYELAR